MPFSFPREFSFSFFYLCGGVSFSSPYLCGEGSFFLPPLPLGEGRGEGSPVMEKSIYLVFYKNFYGQIKEVSVYSIFGEFIISGESINVLTCVFA